MIYSTRNGLSILRSRWTQHKESITQIPFKITREVPKNFKIYPPVPHSQSLRRTHFSPKQSFRRDIVPSSEIDGESITESIAAERLWFLCSHLIFKFSGCELLKCPWLFLLRSFLSPCRIYRVAKAAITHANKSYKTQSAACREFLGKRFLHIRYGTDCACGTARVLPQKTPACAVRKGRPTVPYRWC